MIEDTFPIQYLTPEMLMNASFQNPTSIPNLCISYIYIINTYTSTLLKNILYKYTLAKLFLFPPHISGLPLIPTHIFMIP